MCMECTSHGGVLVKLKTSMAVLAVIASEKPAQGLALPEGPAQDPDQPAAVEASALPEEGAAPVGAAPGTTGNIG